MYLFTFSGTTVLLGMGSVCLLIALGIYFLRSRMRGAKTEAADLFGYSPAIYRVSLCTAIFASFLAINWTQYDDAPVYAGIPEQTVEIIEMIPRTIDPPKPAPPPPPPPVKIEPVVEDAPSVQMIDQSIEESDFVPPSLATAPRVRKEVPPPPPLPPPVEDPGIVDIFGLERMPTFGKECLSLSDEARKTCSDRELLTFIQKGLRYPALARNNGIEGIVFVRFVVEKDGSLSGIEAVRGLSGGCTEAALEAIERINVEGRKFSPGIQNSSPVRVSFNLPIKFQLD